MTEAEHQQRESKSSKTSEGKAPERGLSLLQIRWRITAAIMLSIFLAALDVTAVAPAMPRIVAHLGGGEWYSWAFSIYAVLSTTVTPLFGRLADRIGRRKVILSGISVFLLGSIACGLSPSMPFFLLSRAVQGIGAGALMPAAFTIIGDLYELKARARIQGLLSGVWGVASLVGPLVGGTLVETAGWRWVFFINIPFGLLAAWALRRYLHEARDPSDDAPLDPWGILAFSLAVILLLASLKNQGWLQFALLTSAIAAFAFFVWREQSAREPLFDLSLFRIPMYSVANASGFFSGAVLLSLSAYLPVYVMNVRGGSAVTAGLMIAPLSFGWVLASNVGARLISFFGFRTLVLSGLTLLTGATFAFSQISATISWPLLSLVAFIGGLGFGLNLSILLVAVQEKVDNARRGQATSAVQFYRQMGGAIGVAVLELVFVSRLADPTLLEASPGRALAAAAKDQLMSGFSLSFLVATGLSALAWLIALATPRR